MGWCGGVFLGTIRALDIHSRMSEWDYISVPGKCQKVFIASHPYRASFREVKKRLSAAILCFHPVCRNCNAIVSVPNILQNSSPEEFMLFFRPKEVQDVKILIMFTDVQAKCHQSSSVHMDMALFDSSFTHL